MSYSYAEVQKQREEEQKKIAAFGRRYWKIYTSEKMSEGDKVAAKYQLNADIKEAKLSPNQIAGWVMNNQTLLEQESQLEKLAANPNHTQEKILKQLKELNAKLK